MHTPANFNPHNSGIAMISFKSKSIFSSFGEKAVIAISATFQLKKAALKASLHVLRNEKSKHSLSLFSHNWNPAEV